MASVGRLRTWSLVLGFLLVSLSALAAQSPERRTVDVAYFGLPSCHDCREFLDTTWEDLRRSSALEGIDLKLVEYDILDAVAFARMKDLLDKQGQVFTGVPVLITADRVIQGNDLEPAKLAQLLGVATDSKPTGQVTSQPLTWLVVGTAGLVDGVNPCVLTILIFLLSVWKIDSKRGLGIGIAYAAGVYLAYTLVGLGLLQAAALTTSVPWAGPLIEGVAVGSLLVLVLLSLWDAWQASKGTTAGLVLKLPRAVDELIRRVVRSQKGLLIGLPLAFVLGGTVSLLEFVCTGQVYLPTLVYMNQTGGENSLLLLLWYNFAFIVPLLLVFVLVKFGTNHATLVRWARSHLTTSKLLLALVYAALAAVILFV